MTLLVSNPPRSTRKLRKKARRRKARAARRRRRVVVRTNPTPRSQPVPRKRRRSRRTSFNFTRRARRSSKRRSSRRASSGFGSNRKIAGMVSTSMLTSAAAGVAGFVGCQLLLDKLAAQFNIDAVKVGNGRIVGKAAAALIAGFVAKKLGAPTHLASAIAGGGLIAAGVDVYSKVANKPAGTAGMGVIEVDGNPYLNYGGLLGQADDDEDLGAYGYPSTQLTA